MTENTVQPPPETPTQPQRSAPSRTPTKDKKREAKKRRTGRMVAIATIVSAILAIPATVYPIWKDMSSSSKAESKPQTHHLFDGPIAQIAAYQENWDVRGFDPSVVRSLASPVVYQYAGHYKDENGDRNPDNQMCSIELYANPAGTFPYGGESGFVYIQPGTATHPASEILYNPKNPDAVYRLQMKNGQYVPPQCWPGDGLQNNDVRYPHGYNEYFTPR